MRNVHIVSHTHWDREWYRTYQQFRLKLVHLIDGLLEILMLDPDFKFFMLDGQTILLDDYLQMRPEMEAVLRKHVRSGRILIGPWHILPDMFLVGPEAHIRNLLQGEQTASRFGPKMSIGYIPDPFGHPGQTPQLMQGFGIQTVSLWRGVEDGPAEFWWEAPDGSRVLMVYLRDGYGNGAELPADQPERFSEMLATRMDTLAPVSSTSHFLVMYGTDHMEPPRATSAAIAYADRALPGRRVFHSTLPRYVAAIQAQIKKSPSALPTVRGELRACKRMHLLPGVLSTRMWIKQRNQACESLLIRWVEPFSTFASLMDGQATPGTLRDQSGILHHAWRLLMENHPHDSICGCSIDQVHEEMKVRFDQVEQIGEELSRESLNCLAAQVDTRSTNSACAAIVVFNPCGAPRSDLVEALLDLPAGVDQFELRDERGALVPFQMRGMGNKSIVNMRMDAKGLQTTFGAIHDGKAGGMAVQALDVVREGSQVRIDAILCESGEPNLPGWEKGRQRIEAFLKDPGISSYLVRARSVSTTRILFSLQHVPGLGYRTLHVHPCPVGSALPTRFTPLMRILLPLLRLPQFQRLLGRQAGKRNRPVLENEFFRVTGCKDGTLAVFDKATRTLYPGLNRFLDGGDCGDEYNYSPPLHDRILPAQLKRITCRAGDALQTLDLELEMDLPIALSLDRKTRTRRSQPCRVRTQVTLAHGVARIDLHTSIDNPALDHRLRVHFPAPFACEHGSHDGHFEIVQRPIGVPAYDDSWVEQPRPEVPQRSFSDVSDGQQGLMIANRGLPEVEILRRSDGTSEIALTLLRCIGWLSRDDFSTRKGHAGPAMETPAAQMLGRWDFEYSIIPHAGSWQTCMHEARAFETSLRAVLTDLHPGSLPPTGSLIEVQGAAFQISTIKQAEDGEGWILRGYNPLAEPIQVRLKLWRPFKHILRANLAEQGIGKIKSRHGLVDLQAGGHEILTLRFRD